jgi:hypothetical protein
LPLLPDQVDAQKMVVSLRRVIADKTGKPATLRRASLIAPAGFIVAKRHVGGAGRHAALAAFFLACPRCGPLCYRQHGRQFFSGTAVSLLGA